MQEVNPLFCAYKAYARKLGAPNIARRRWKSKRSNKRGTRLYLTARMGVFRLGERCIFHGNYAGIRGRIKCIPYLIITLLI